MTVILHAQKSVWTLQKVALNEKELHVEACSVPFNKAWKFPVASVSSMTFRDHGDSFPVTMQE